VINDKITRIYYMKFSIAAQDELLLKIKFEISLRKTMA